MPKKRKRSQARRLHWQRSNDVHCTTPTTEEAECVPQSSGQVKMSAASHTHSVKHGGQQDTSGKPQVSYADIVKRARKSDGACEAGPSNVNEVNNRGQTDVTFVPKISYADVVKRGHSYAGTGPSIVNQVNNRSKTDVTFVPQVSYADIVKRGLKRDAECVAGPSHAYQVNHRCQSDETYVPGPHAESENLGDQPSERHVRASRSQASIRYGRFKNQQCICNSLTFLAFLYENENITRAHLGLVLNKFNVMYKEVRKRVTIHI